MKILSDATYDRLQRRAQMGMKAQRDLQILTLEAALAGFVVETRPEIPAVAAVPATIGMRRKGK